jgi:hypothetical protein
MSPQEKAKELVDKFDGVGLQMRNEAIACALIAVDELIEVAFWAGDIDGEIEERSKEYYLEVKKEIELL